MRHFTIRLASTLDVLRFVNVCSRLGVRVTVSCGSHRVNGSSLLGLFTLDFRKPLEATVEGTDSDEARFAVEAERFLLK